MSVIKSMFATLGFVSLTAISCPRGIGQNDAERTGSPQEPVPMPKELQAETRAQCAFLEGPEYHECIYAVITHRLRWQW
jgi:hypothetical protein